MTRPGLSNIPSPTGTNNPRRLPTRAQLRGPSVRYIKRGRPHKADLLYVDIGDGPLIVKDFAAKSRWRRWLGRMQISREYRAYRRLGPIDGIPRLLGRIDAWALAMQSIEGGMLIHAPNRFSEAPSHLAQIRGILDRMHARGVLHGDLRSRDNVVLGRDGRIVILDLASAVRLRPGSLAHRIFFPWVKMIDDSAYLKWKYTLHSSYNPEEVRLLRRHGLWRSLWWFNRKRAEGEPRAHEWPR